GFVGTLDALPDRERFWEWLRADQAARGNALPPGVKDTIGLMCTAIGYPTVQSFVVRYPDRDPIGVTVDQNCGTVYANGRTRFTQRDPVGDFLRRYRDQVARGTDAAKIATPRCAETLTPQQLGRGPRDGGPRDEVSQNKTVKDPQLPDPLVAVAVCRY